MIRKLLELLKLVKPRHPHLSKTAVVRSSFPVFHIDKHYNDMNRRERREYKRWLEKHQLWDGAVVIENLEREQRLSVRD
jgi:hypothetical protein